MEFSICCLTPPPNFREVEWGGGGVGLDQKSEISNFFDLVLSTLKTCNLGLKLPFYVLSIVLGGWWCTYDYSVSLSLNIWIMTFNLDLDLDLGLTIVIKW